MLTVGWAQPTALTMLHQCPDLDPIWQPAIDSTLLLAAVIQARGGLGGKTGPWRQTRRQNGHRLRDPMPERPRAGFLPRRP